MYEKSSARNDLWWISNPRLAPREVVDRIRHFGMNLEFRDRWQCTRGAAGGEGGRKRTFLCVVMDRRTVRVRVCVCRPFCVFFNPFFWMIFSDSR